MPHTALPLQTPRAGAAPGAGPQRPGLPTGLGARIEPSPEALVEPSLHAFPRTRPDPHRRQLVQVAVATLLVAGAPVAIVWWLRASGMVPSPVVAVLIGMGLSLSLSQLGCRLWKTRPGSEDLLFSELMIWGYLHRRHTQRRLGSALDMVGPMGAEQRPALHGLSTNEQARRLERLVAEMETSDPYLHGHSRRVARHSWMIARRMGLPRAEVARIRTAAAVHDVGKIRTPTRILHKPGKLTAEEYDVIKRHPGDGAVMADILRDPALTSIVRHHHERLDGSGYPDGLRGDAIPIGARIIAVADTFDAITSERPYRPASAHKGAIDILRHEAGTRLDADVVRAFCGHYAGRAPIALWAAMAGVPERVLSWLGASVTSALSAAKVVAVAALVGGVAATSSVLGVPLARSHPAATHRGALTQRRAGSLPSAGAAAHASALARSQSVSAHRGRPPHGRPRPRIRTASTRAHAPAQPGVGGASSQGQGTAATPHKSEERAAGRTGEGHGNGAVGGANRAEGGSGAEGGAGRGDGRAGSPQHKPAGAPGKPAKGGGEAGQRAGAPPRAAEQPHGKAEEAAPKSAAGRAQSEEAAAKAAEAPGKGERASSPPAEMRGKSESAHGSPEPTRAPTGPAAA